METKNFKKRFHCCGIPEKIRIAELLGACISKRKMPGGRIMIVAESKALADLLEWCNMNIFFDSKPSTT